MLILLVETTKSQNNYCIIITGTADMKIMTKAHRCHCKSNYSTTKGFEDRESYHCKQQAE